ncbi:hypothetical protein GMES_2949 [Paraglaciecola mesophila KMM 241]|uniref:Uncharacterized protein n=1 Tax=Paraglaciecola mesophila KMM 241 TaxID=1128912 RepID=K6XXA6_9ALTE|nr:hypothetical protein GMES_2949 [Paraglaciecola mesophila KMM 241]
MSENWICYAILLRVKKSPAKELGQIVYSGNTYKLKHTPNMTNISFI